MCRAFFCLFAGIPSYPMGRTPTVNKNLPRGMRARRQKSGVVHYYFDHGGKPRKETPLGSDYLEAVRKWADLAKLPKAAEATPELILFPYVIERYKMDVLPRKAERTQKDNLVEMGWLLRFFGDPPAPLDEIRPIHVRQYLDWRKSAPVRAKREKALLSHIWNYARDKGFTDLPNPCRGITGQKEKGRRDIYLDDDVYDALLAQAGDWLADAIMLGYLTGQRPSDVRMMEPGDVSNDRLIVRQGKTDAVVRLLLNGDDGKPNELGKLVARLIKDNPTTLIHNQDGEPITQSAMIQAFAKCRARAADLAEKMAAKAPNNDLAERIRRVQFRDLRAKAGTDKAAASGILAARIQLGHTSVKMTEQYVRLGTDSAPTK